MLPLNFKLLVLVTNGLFMDFMCNLLQRATRFPITVLVCVSAPCLLRGHIRDCSLVLPSGPILLWSSTFLSVWISISFKLVQMLSRLLPRHRSLAARAAGSWGLWVCSACVRVGGQALAWQPGSAGNLMVLRATLSPGSVGLRFYMQVCSFLGFCGVLFFFSFPLESFVWLFVFLFVCF